MKIKALKACLLGLAAFVLFLVMPAQSLMAQEFDGFLRIGLRQYFANRQEINIYSQQLEVGAFYDGFFHVLGHFNSGQRFTVRPAAYGGVVSLYADGLQVLNGETTLQFRDISGITNLGVRQYRGVIEIASLNPGTVSAINIVHMDEYLFSVVPSEMPASWHMEALKSQAVAARTFTLYRMASWAGHDYNLCDTVFSQVYSGTFREHERTTQAVLATTGLVMLYGGQPILAAYSSCAGGFTANSEDVWFATLPYLRSVPERHDATDMLWRRTITLSELSGLLRGANVSIGDAVAIQLIHNPQGRVMQLIIIGTNGNHMLERENIRSFFGPLDGSSLRSRNFNIVGAPVAGGFLQSANPAVYIASATGISQSTLAQLGKPYGAMVMTAYGLSIIDQPAMPMPQENVSISSGYHIHLEGRGWGHGVGMSQHGARAMADMGYNFMQILNWYYTGIQIVMR
ncbi:MAG: SpoIID/LytB domain-containing protein [Defluviitaleaceae bacterium]|nr:SpoIID/LytB domain-containing protein [Defluviitaleaceae bacterium]